MLLGQRLAEAIQEAIEAVDELQSLKLPERKVRLAELKERFKLLRLYSKAEMLSESLEAESGDTEPAELIAVRSYLEPLGLAEVGTSVVELARLAALKVMEK
jgi:hypothetical protein